VGDRAGAVRAHSAAVRTLQPGAQVHGGGLARAVAAEEGEDLSCGHLERDVLDRLESAVTLPEPAYQDRCHAPDSAGRGRAAAVKNSRPSRQRDQRSEEHTSELQSRENLVCRLLLEKK